MSATVEGLIHETYLGDAVYAGYDRFGAMVIYTTDGIQHEKPIILEPETFAALIAYAKRIGNLPQ